MVSRRTSHFLHHSATFPGRICSLTESTHVSSIHASSLGTADSITTPAAHRLSTNVLDVALALNDKNQILQKRRRASSVVPADIQPPTPCQSSQHVLFAASHRNTLKSCSAWATYITLSKRAVDSDEKRMKCAWSSPRLPST